MLSVGLVDLSPERPSVATWRISALDGLRGFAVVAVMAHHFRVSIGGVQLLRGGFVGVDLFFVLSGFLIGSLIVGEVGRTGRVGLVAFWSRRFRRLLPASAILLVAVCIWGATVGWGRAISDDVVASAFWFQNWHLINVGQSYGGGRTGTATGALLVVVH